MGSGKSHTGKRLAKWLARDFIDLDDSIEQATGLTISDIFQQQGEAHFRQLESDCLRATAKLPPAVIACGGGTPCQHGNMTWMNTHGITVFLDPSPEVLVKRLSKEFAHRPLLAEAPDLKKFIIDKLESRRSIYEQAQYQIKINEDNTAVERMIMEVLEEEE